MADTAQIRADFDRIAKLLPQGRRLTRSEEALLAAVPRRCRRALDVGCGDGLFAERLAERTDQVTALDLSPEMIRRARARSTRGNVAYTVGDLLTWSDGDFDVVASVAALHHVDLEVGLGRLAGWVRPGGLLLVHDLLASVGPLDRAADVVAFLLTRAPRLLRRSAAPELAAAWRDHSAHEDLRPTAEIRALAARVLPGATVRRHLEWRYTLAWRRPEAEASVTGV
jgi:2-polyprenyl-3-methyl-5-hydroxy-6-metoxy-1,4-benzoquinol methylase